MGSRMKRLARKIRELKFKGLSDREIAEVLGISRSYVGYIRKIAWERWLIAIPRGRRGKNLDEVLHGIIIVLSRNNGGIVRSGEVYRLYNFGAELGYWEKCNNVSLVKALKRLEKAVIQSSEYARS